MISRCIGFFILFACFVASSTAITTTTDSIVTLTPESSLGLETNTNTLDSSYSALETISITSSSLEGQFSAYITSFHSNHDSSVLENTISSASELPFSLSALSLSLSQTPPLLNIQPSTSATVHLRSSEEPHIILSATHISDGSFNAIFSNDLSQSNVYSANDNFIFSTPSDLQFENVQTSYPYHDPSPATYSSVHEGTHDSTYLGDSPILTTIPAQNSDSELTLVVESLNSDINSEIPASVPLSSVTPILPVILSTVVSQDIWESQVTPTVTSVYGESSVVASQSNVPVIDHPSISEKLTTTFDSKTPIESFVINSDIALTKSSELEVVKTSDLLETILGKETQQLLFTSFQEVVIQTLNSKVLSIASQSIVIDYTSYPIDVSSSSLSMRGTSVEELLSGMSGTGSTSITEAVPVLSDASPSLQTSKDAGVSTEVIEATAVSTESLPIMEPESTVDVALIPSDLEFTLVPSISTLITFYQESPEIVIDLTSASMSDMDQATFYTPSFTFTNPELPSFNSQIDTKTASKYLPSDMIVTNESDFIVTDPSDIVSSDFGLYSDESYSSLLPTSTSDFHGIVLSDSSLSFNSEDQITLMPSQNVLSLLTPASRDILTPYNTIVSEFLVNNSPISFSSETLANLMVDSFSSLISSHTNQYLTHDSAPITPSIGSLSAFLSEDSTPMIGSLTTFVSGDALTVSGLTLFASDVNTSLSGLLTPSQSEQVTPSLISDYLTPTLGSATPFHSDHATTFSGLITSYPYQSEILTPIQIETLTPSQSEILTHSQSETLTPSQSEMLTPSKSETLTPSQSDLSIPSHSETLTPSQSESNLETLTPSQSETVMPLLSDILLGSGTIMPIISDLMPSSTPLYSDLTPLETVTPLGTVTPQYSDLTSFHIGLLTVYSETLTSAVDTETLTSVVSEAPWQSTMLTLTENLTPTLSEELTLTPALSQSLIQTYLTRAIESSSISTSGNVESMHSQSTSISDLSGVSLGSSIDGTAFSSMISSSESVLASDFSQLSNSTAMLHTGSFFSSSDITLSFSDSSVVVSDTAPSDFITSDHILTSSLVFSLHSSSLDTSLVIMTSLDSLDILQTSLASDSSLHSGFGSTSLNHDLIDSLTTPLGLPETISEINFKSISDSPTSELVTSETNSLTLETHFLPSITEVFGTGTSATESLQIETSSLESESVVLTVTESLPFGTESLAETLPHLTETLVLLTETLPHLTETLPLLTETLPHLTETLPLLTETLPHLTETLPLLTETLPHLTETLPLLTETLPHLTETLPLLTETLPHLTETLPLLTESLPHLTETLPIMSEIVTSETLPFLTDSRSVIIDSLSSVTEESVSMILTSLSHTTASLTVTEATLQPSSTPFESTPSTLIPSFITSSALLTTVTSSAISYSPSISTSIDSSSVSTASSVVPNVTEGLNSSDSYMNYWIRTVLIVGQEVNVTTDEFEYEIELKLANAYDEAYQRQNASEQQLSRKKRMAVSDSGDIKLQINNITRDNTSDEVEFIYLLMKNGSYILASEAVRVFGYLSDQEVALRLGYVVVVKAEPYIPIPLAEEDKKLWIIGAVLGPVALFLFIWLIMCITFRCCRRSKETKPQLVLMKKSDTPPEGNEYSRPAPHPEDSYIEEPLDRSNGPMLYSNPKRGLYEVNPESEQDLVQPFTQSPQKKSPTKIRSNGVVKSEVLSDTGDTVTYISEGDLTTTKAPKPKTRKSKPRSRDTAHIAVPDEGEADRSDSPPDQQTAELLQIERKRNKQRLRDRRKVDNSSKSSDVDQNYQDVHKSKKRPSKPRRNKIVSQLNGGYSDDENDEKPPETLHEARKRMHQLLDDAFSLMSTSTSSIGSSTSKTSLGRLARNKVGHQDDLESSKPPRHPRSKKPEKSRKTIEEETEIPERDKKQHLPEKQHTPMFINRAYTSDLDDGIESWTPYRAGDVVHKIGDEVLRISLPHSQPIKQKSPRQDKLVTSTFVNDDLESSLRDNFHNNEHAKAIEIQTKDLNDTNHKLNGIAHKSLDIPNGYHYPGLKNYEDIPIIEVTKDGNMLSFVDDNIELDDLVAKTKNIPNGNLQNGNINGKFHHTPYQAWKGEDEMDILKKAIKPGEAPTPLIESIRDELNHLSKSRSENKQLNISATSDIHV